MSGLQRIPPQVPTREQLGGKNYSYRNEIKGLLGQVLESQQVSVTKDDVYVTQWQKEKACLVDYLAIVGGVAIVFFGLWLFVQGVKGVMKSEKSTGNTIDYVANGTVAGTELRGGMCPGLYG